MKSVSSRLLAMIILILVIGALGLLARQFGSMQWIIENENQLREFVSQHPWRGWMLGFAIYTLFSLVPGTVGKSVVFGWIFGFWQAVLMVDIGLTIAGLGGFLASRFIIRDLIKSRFRRLVGILDGHVDKDGAYYLVLMRVAHVPFSVVNYCAGATSIRPLTFTWTTALGLLPGTMIFVFVGTRIPTLATIAESGIWPLLDPMLFAMLAATLVFPVVIQSAIRRFRSRAEADRDLADLNELNSWSTARRTNGLN